MSVLPVILVVSYLIVLAYGVVPGSSVVLTFLSSQLLCVPGHILIAHGVVGSLDSELGICVHGKLAPLWHIDKTSVEDPDSFYSDPDPDPAFQVNPDRGFWWPEIENKNIAEFFFTVFDKNCNLVLPRPTLDSSNCKEVVFSVTWPDPILWRGEIHRFLAARRRKYFQVHGGSWWWTHSYSCSYTDVRRN